MNNENNSAPSGEPGQKTASGLAPEIEDSIARYTDLMTQRMARKHPDLCVYVVTVVSRPKDVAGMVHTASDDKPTTAYHCLLVAAHLEGVARHIKDSLRVQNVPLDILDKATVGAGA